MSTTREPPLFPGASSGGPGGPDRLDDHDGRRPRHWPGRRALAALLATSAILGGFASAGALAVAGVLGDGGSTTATTATTVLRSVASDTSSRASASFDAKAVYASAAAGVVDITATGAGSAPIGPFGRGSSQSTATGSGFVADGTGSIVTAAHVVDGATSIKVTFSNGTTRTATLAGKDDATDVAVLKVDPSGLSLHPLALGSSGALRVGDPVAAIGSPFGYAESLSTGVVSGLDRTIDAPNGFTVAHAIQTDTALNPGNSGGPILDSGGRVIGVADQIATGGSSQQSSGVGFAVPIDLIAAELGKLGAGQTVSHAYLGVSTTASTSSTGALVASVTGGSPAASGGVQPGDVVTAFDGRRVTGSSGLVATIAGRSPGDKVQLTVRRGSGSRTLTVTLRTQPRSQSSAQ
ncbi:MAG: putative serine protease PepD [Solirubrobacteraceae bacterium]|nr:putative serine protease PepD [Solirubrobacteraceae bacterium]